MKIKYKGLWTPQYLSEHLYHGYKAGLTIRQIEMLLENWATEILEENVALPQANVSDNEANQSENKKDGEVAVAFAEFAVNNFENNGKIEEHKRWRSVFDEKIFTTQELYEYWKTRWEYQEFQRGKSN